MRFFLSVSSQDLDRLFGTLEAAGFLLLVGRAGADLDDAPETTGRLLLTALPPPAPGGGPAPGLLPISSAASEVVWVADVEVDPHARLAWRGGTPLRLSGREFDLLAALAAHPDRVVSRRDLVTEVWGDGSACSSNALEVHVSTLRRKLEAHGPRLIETVRGVGYRLRSHPEGARPSRRPPSRSRHVTADAAGR